ncbi:flavin-containing monooxygenase [Halobium palmae]|uniref:Flavin-containing monooxygenase n=1 Tax=Halobium palmae TaxID=1776492 RepID=A0ABD5RWN1_9EURY
MDTHYDVVVIGGGQAGLATSYHLREAGSNHIVLERDRVGERWRTERWDSFTLVTPNSWNRLPGFAYDGDDPEGFLSREEVIAYLEEYVERFELPVRVGVEVTGVRADTAGFTVETTDGIYEAATVVVATGSFQEPRVPDFTTGVPVAIHQVHSSGYTNPETLPEGAVLVVGSSQSGAQIASELHETGRDVFLSVSSAPKLPRRYRGRDVGHWMEAMGGFRTTVDDLESPAARFAPSAYASGRDGGREIDFLELADDGMTLLGRVIGVEDGRIRFADDLEENLRNAYRFYVELIEDIERYLETTDEDAPEPKHALPNPDEISVESIRELDLTAATVRTIVWATGYRADFSWIEPVDRDEFGYPVHRRGVTDTPGLYFVGLHWLYTRGSGLLYGVGEDAKYVVEHLLERVEGSKSRS